MRKRIFPALLSICMVIAISLPQAALAAESNYTFKVIIKPQYQDAGTFSNGLAAVKKDDQWGYVDESGKMVISPQFVAAGVFYDGAAVVVKEKADTTSDSMVYQLCLIKKDGTLLELQRRSMEGDLVPNVYYNEEDIELGKSFLNGGVFIANGEPYTASGKLIEPQNTAQMISVTHDGYRAGGSTAGGAIPMRTYHMADGGGAVQCFLMDANGTITKTFTPASLYSDDGNITWLYGVDKATGLVVAESGYYNDNYDWTYGIGVAKTDGTWVAQPKYRSFRYMATGEYFCDGLFTVVDFNGKYGAIDKNGQVIVPLLYEFMGSYQQGLVQVLLNGQYYYLDTQGATYQIENISGGRGDIGAASHFSDAGVAAVYDTVSQKGYCIQYTPVNQVFPVIDGTDSLDRSVYFPGYVEGEAIDGIIRGVGDIITIKEGGLWGFAKLSFTIVAHDNPFRDVLPGDYFYDPVLWARDEKITSGASATSFEPDETCTRGQVVTFLWRAMGEPKPSIKENPFTDVKSNDYYYDAVLWAYENNITSGATATTFEPEEGCTRGQVVTFQWRTKDEPAASGSTGFNDVQSGAYYETAVKWAVKNNITSGTTAATFAPDETCTRGQIVTFLYRDMAE